MSRNSRAWWEVTLAALHAGVVTIPVNWHWTSDELAYVLQDGDARLLFVSGELSEVALEATDQLEGVDIPVLVIGDHDPIEGTTDLDAALAVEPDDELDRQYAARPMLYTSGTTGRPKGVVPREGPETAEGFAARSHAFLDLMGMRPGMPTLVAGPAYHSAPWSFALLPFLTGSTLVTPSTVAPTDLLDLVERHRIANVHLVPTQFVRLLRLPEETREGFDPDSLEVVAHGGAPCDVATKHRMIAWWGPVITEYYGGTETGMITKITATEWLEHPGSVGRVVPLDDLRIVDAAGHDVDEGAPGVIWARRRGADFEYHNAPEKTRAAHDAHGFGSGGDIGYLRDGNLYISDRQIDMIISGGVNIYPAEIEAALQDHPAVLDAAVVGVPDAEFGESVVAFIQTDGRSNDPQDELAAKLRAHCRDRLAGYKCPRHFRFTEELPRSETGKLVKGPLRRLVREEQQ